VPRIVGGTLERHRQQALDRIFAAFAQLTYERGYDAVTLSDVAVAAGMSRTTMYNYFADKDALLVGFTAHETAGYVASLRERLAEADGPVERLRTYVREQFAYFASRHLPPGPALRAVLSDGAYRRVLDHVGPLEQLLREILQEGVDAGSFDVPVESTVPLVLACLGRAGAGDLDPADLEEVTAASETFLLRALGATGAEAGRAARPSRDGR
jgi:AcrR family transcriptional regulator